MFIPCLECLFKDLAYEEMKMSLTYVVTFCWDAYHLRLGILFPLFCYRCTQCLDLLVMSFLDSLDYQLG